MTAARPARTAPRPSPAAAAIAQAPAGGTATAAKLTSTGCGRGAEGRPQACAGPRGTVSPACAPACCACAPLLPTRPRPVLGRASLNVQARLSAVSSLGWGQRRGRAQPPPSLAAQTQRCPPGAPVHAPGEIHEAAQPNLEARSKVTRSGRALAVPADVLGLLAPSRCPQWP